MKNQTGGPAFPVADGAAHRIAMQAAGDDEAKYIAESAKALSGMTLRDYFAAKFMQGVCANPDKLYDDEPLAKEAYAMADAMLRAREGS
ncbi:hypothetical protein [Citrobacter koseri]|uniref:hypothetical protein n=1 Tax=Citrobacter koseri TaxID=545 RepID=UPI0023B1229F|nr:hypothetical protein [Citrobacter koseri]